MSFGAIRICVRKANAGVHSVAENEIFKKKTYEHTWTFFLLCKCEHEHQELHQKHAFTLKYCSSETFVSSVGTVNLTSAGRWTQCRKCNQSSIVSGLGDKVQEMGFLLFTPVKSCLNWFDYFLFFFVYNFYEDSTTSTFLLQKKLQLILKI